MLQGEKSPVNALKDTATVALKQDRKKSFTKLEDYPEIWKHSLMYIHYEKEEERTTTIISKWSQTSLGSFMVRWEPEK